MINFKPGDTVKVHYKIREGDNVRVQVFPGVVLAVRGEGVSKSFIVRRQGPENVGVERIFPLKSPNLEKVEVVRSGRVRRAKLYYLRHLSEKEAKRKLS